MKCVPLQEYKDTHFFISSFFNDLCAKQQSRQQLVDSPSVHVL